MNQQKWEVIVLGGGYAGVMAALRLSAHRDIVNVTLVNGREHFIERPRLQEVATGRPFEGKSLTELFEGTGVVFTIGWATAIAPAEQIVQIETEEGAKHLQYDRLIYALGSRVDQGGVPGVSQHAYVLNPDGRMAVHDLAEKLVTLSDNQQVVVVGGGATGVEAAPQIKGVYPNLQVTLLSQDEVGGFKGERIMRHIHNSLQKQQIEMREHTPVQTVHEDHLVTVNGESIPFDLCLWAGGFVGQPLAREAGIRVNKRMQVAVDPTLRSTSHPAVYAVGDAAHPVEEPGVVMRMSLLPALIAGALAADNVLAEFHDKTLKPLSFAYYGQGIALGLEDAVGFFGYPSDQAIGPILRRKAAIGIREFFLWMLLKFLAIEKRFPGFFFWVGRGRYARSQRREARQIRAQQSL